MRTEIIWLRSGHPIGKWCHKAKNLYNAANYEVRQEFFSSGNWLKYREIEQIMRFKNMGEKISKIVNDYTVLPSGSAQQTLMLLDKNWKGFFTAIKEWKKHPEKFLGKPRIPGYYQKDGEMVLIFTNVQAKIKDGILKEVFNTPNLNF